MSDIAPGGDEAVAPKATIIEHLVAFRKVLIVCAIAVIIGFLVVFWGFSERLLLFLTYPLLSMDVQVINIGVAEAFIARLRVSLIAGIVIAFPIICWKFWSFVKPALFPNERFKFILIFFITLLLFLSGVLFAYFLVLNIAINFLITFGEAVATPMISISMYIDMLFRFILPFGLAFEFPVVIYVLHELEFVSLKALKKARKYVLFGMFVLATILTPPDLISQIMLAVPLYALYEASILVLRIVAKRKEKNAEAEAEA